MNNKILKRKEVPEEYTWNMKDLYENEELFSDEAKKLEELFDQFKSYEGSLSDVIKLVEAIKVYEQMNYYFGRLYVYANQKSHEDMGNAKYQQMSGEMQIMATSFDSAVSWFEPELFELPEGKLESFLAECDDMKPYKRFLEQIIRRKEHVLDKEHEGLLSRVGEIAHAPSHIFSMFNNADIRFPDILDAQGNSHPLTNGTYISYMESKDRILRKNAFEAMYSVYGQFNNMLGAIYYNNMKQADFFAKERNYENALCAKLYDNEIPVEVYDQLIEATHKALPDMYAYVKKRKNYLGVEELHMYDVYVPLSDAPEKKYSFEEAKEIVLEGLAPLGEDYLDLLREGFENRWIDVYENVGKRTGAYSWGAYGTHPYVLLNYHGSLNDVFTLAHEMGHSIHTYYSNKTQNILDADYRIFVAEVASTCNESLLIHHLLKNTDDVEERKYLINYFLDQFKGTMFRQTMFAEFEKIAHSVVAEGGMITGKQLSEIYLNLNKKYFGETMISDEQISYEWSKIPHFYTPFYVYQYSTAFAAAIAISKKILEGEDGIVEKYKEFLSGGCSKTPIDLLKICGVDMSTSKPVEDALAVFKDYLELL